ncbi:hypothetical protein GGS20DRAFT_575910 [Poronia punctata]|nr:hypothetical protein GGS20DRAFT_575910 [Poronia punctata]
MNEETLRRRRRPALACIPCRLRKVKCDRASPCGRCLSTRKKYRYRLEAIEDIQGNDESDPTPLSSEEPLYLGRAQIPDGIIPTTRVGQPSAPTHATPPTGNGRVSTRDTHGTGGILEAATIRKAAERSEHRDESTKPDPLRSISETGQSILARQAGLGDSDITLKKTRLLRWSDWMGGAPEFSPVYNWFQLVCDENEAISHTGKDLLSDIGTLYQKCKMVTKKLKASRPSRCFPSAKATLEPPLREVADTMAKLYFQCFEPIYKILHEPTFWSEYRMFWGNPEDASMALRLKILLVVGIGSSVYEEASQDSELRHMVILWIHTAQLWLSGPLEKDRLNIPGCKAMQIGMHRDPKHLLAMSTLEAEVRRRLWFTILEMVVQSALDSAMPPRVSFHDFDTEPPSNVDDYELSESTTMLQAHPREKHTSTSMQLQLIDSLPIRLKPAQRLNGLNSEQSYSDACKECRKFGKSNARTGVTAFQRNLCDYMIRRFLIPLHCPFASEACANPLFHFSRKVTLDAALTFLSPEPEDHFALLMARGGGMFREGFRYAAATVTLGLLVEAETCRLDGTYRRRGADASARHLDFLRQVVDRLSTMAWERIRQGETNIKSHMFIAVVLAIADADGDGLCEVAMARHARDSFSSSLELLEARANSLGLGSHNTHNESGFAPPRLGGDDGFAANFVADFFFQDMGYV